MTALRSSVMEWGNAAEWFGGTGAIIAAIAALNIAGRDRKERKRERDAAAIAQMRLVLIEVEPYEDSKTLEHTLRVSVTNFGQRPILRIEVLSTELFTTEDIDALHDPDNPKAPSASYKLCVPDTLPSVISVLPSAEQQLKLTGVSSRPDGRFLISVRHVQNGRPWPARRRDAAIIEVTIECTDADGVRWKIVNNRNIQPQRSIYYHAIRIPRWRRLFRPKNDIFDIRPMTDGSP